MDDEYTSKHIDFKDIVWTKGQTQRIKRLVFTLTKRGFDVSFSLLGLISLAPIFFSVALLIKLDSQGPVFFRQERTGKYGKKFVLYKFRSMVVDNDIHDFTCDDKYTRIGEFLRKSSLDELPQLINIIKGEMSFIGPRPWIDEFNPYYTKRQRQRFTVKPGITGLAQVNGRNSIDILKKIEYDIEYVNDYSLQTDLKILLKTFTTVFNAKEGVALKIDMKKDLDMLMENQKKEVKAESSSGNEKKKDYQVIVEFENKIKEIIVSKSLNCLKLLSLQEFINNNGKKIPVLIFREEINLLIEYVAGNIHKESETNRKQLLVALLNMARSTYSAEERYILVDFVMKVDDNSAEIKILLDQALSIMDDSKKISSSTIDIGKLGSVEKLQRYNYICSKIDSDTLVADNFMPDEKYLGCFATTSSDDTEKVAVKINKKKI